MKRTHRIGWAVLAALAAAGFGFGLGWIYWHSGRHNMADYLSKQLYLELPAGAEIAVQDSHCGFHGDGVLLAVIRLTPEQSEQFAAQIAQVWDELPMEEEMAQTFFMIWEQYGAAFQMPPEDMEGRWFYRDRYFEQYGERCKGNPIAQNCTFALFDQESGTLYVLENDL